MPAATRPVLRIGTRESALARLQTSYIIEALGPYTGSQRLEVVALSTSGDKILNKPIADLGGTGVFVKELEEALLENRVDLVVHSLKDMPTEIPEGLYLAATLKRDDPRDVFLSRDGSHFEAMPPGSKIATSSRRRAAQLTIRRKDLEFVDVRGNVQTRLRKLEEGQCDGMILAAAGLLRLGLKEKIVHFLEPETSVPAAGQGALAVECREQDDEVRALLAQIHDDIVCAEVTAERAFLKYLGGGCSVPIGVLGRYQPDSDSVFLTAVISDGQRIARGKLSGTRAEAEQTGIALAKKMLADGGAEILETIMGRPVQPISPP